MTRALAWLGARAPWALAAGIAICFVIPQVSHAVRPALPFLVPLVLGLAMARVDLGGSLRAALAPRRLAGLVAVIVLMLPASALAYLGAARVLHLGPELSAALVYLAAAPPIASAAGLCFILGLNARLALDVTLAGMVLMPLLGPATVAVLLPGGAAPAAGALALKLAAMIAAAALLAVAIRRLAGPGRMARNAAVLDGLGVLALFVFVVPLFDGVPAAIAARPVHAAAVLALVTAANLGVNLAVACGLGRTMPRADAGALGIVFGNRTVAMYLAALPPDPAFGLFVALYQVPMLLTPLILRRAGRTLFDSPHHET